MKLSEAIRIGASWSPQTRIDWKSSGGTCALGSAYEGTYGTIKLDVLSHDKALDLGYIAKLKTCYPYLLTKVTHPVIGTADVFTLLEGIYILNDGYEWSRERIADWVEKLENENGWTGTEDIREGIPDAVPQTKAA